MAATLWGKVYLHNIYAGIRSEGEPTASRPALSSVYAGRLQEEPGGRCIFTYDDTYRGGENPVPIAHTLPLGPEPYVSEGLHPFFDNLVAEDEGWLGRAQARVLGVHPRNRFARLLGFGYDLAGAVSVEDPEPQQRRQMDLDEATAAAVLGRAALSGVQRKVFLVKDGRDFRPATTNETSTHLAKLPSGDLPNLIEIEYLTTEATRRLLPDHDIVSMQIRRLPAIREDALVIPRFDRTPSGGRRHFEEFTQLLGHRGAEKYEGSYETMGRFVSRYIPAEAYRLMSRVLACLLVGNTDAHYKNFAMFHTRDGLRLTPAYDLVAGSLYRQFQAIALSLAGSRTALNIGQLKPKHLLLMGTGFGSEEPLVVTAIEELGRRLPDALAAVEASPVGSKQLRDRVARNMEKRWKGSFELTGRLSSKKRSRNARR